MQLLRVDAHLLKPAGPPRVQRERAIDKRDQHAKWSPRPPRATPPTLHRTCELHASAGLVQVGLNQCKRKSTRRMKHLVLVHTSPGMWKWSHQPWWPPPILYPITPITHPPGRTPEATADAKQYYTTTEEDAVPVSAFVTICIFIV